MNLVNDSIINAVSWTLIHSLWLGLVLALMAGLTVLLTKKATSAIRYNLLAVLSVLFLITIGVVFSYELKTEKAAQALNLPLKNYLQAQDAFTVSSTLSTKAPESVTDTTFAAVSTFINQYGSWIVCIWFLIFTYKCFRMMGDLRHVYRVRNYQTLTPPEMWQQRMKELKTLLKIQRNVTLLESRLVNIPSVTGLFKPIILVPVGLLNNIPQDQVEAILLHELAHIRRSDYAVNLMQSFMEIMFFFNPGVLWISSLLKDERENCCDDLAISVTNDKKEFVNALVSFQEYNMNAQRFALQFGNQKMNLADRAKRILFNHNKMLSTAEKYFLSVCMAMGAVLCLVIANVHYTSAQEITKSTGMHLPGTVSDSLHANRKYNPKAIPEGTSIKYVDVIDGKEFYTYIFKDKGIFYQVPESMENFMVNGEWITGNNRDKYLDDISRLIESYEITIASEEAEPDYDFSAEEEIIEEASRKIDGHSAIIDKQAQIIEKHSRIIEAEAKKKNINWKKHDEAQRNIEAAHRKIQAESDKINEQSRKIEAESRKIEARIRLQAEAMEMEDESARMEAESRRIEAESRRMEAESRRMETETRRVNKQTQSFAAQPEPPVCSPAPVYLDITESVIGELRKSGYNGNIRSFELNERNLIINGNTQSGALFEKVKKYSKPGMRILYNIEIN